jgi:hypothetical protein
MSIDLSEKWFNLTITLQDKLLELATLEELEMNLRNTELFALFQIKV